MGAVVVQVDAGAVQAQAVAGDTAGHIACHQCTRGDSVTVVSLGERATNAAGDGQGPGGDAASDVADHRGCVAVIAVDTAVAGVRNREAAAASGRNGACTDHVGIVIGQVDTRAVEVHRVTGYGACDGTCQRGTGSSRGAVIGFGECATNAGSGGQGPRRDAGHRICDGGQGEAVIRGHTVGGR